MTDLYSDLPELAAEQAQIRRRQKIAEMIQAKSMEGIPTQPQIGRYAVPTNPLLALGKIGEAYFGKQAMDEADAQQSALGEKATGMLTTERQKIVDAITRKDEKQFTPDMMPGEESQFGKLVESSAKNQTPQDQLGSLIQAGGDARFPANQKWSDTQQKYLVAKIAREDATTAREDERKARALERADAAKIQRDFLEGMQGKRIASTENIAEIKVKGKTNLDGDKPMPPAALKLQQENLDELGVASGIQANMMKHMTAIEDGKLNLGLAGNISSRVANATGNSSDNSKAFATFKADMMQMRNDSLRLNKGTQTEGDATRAWNELFESMNDKDVVLERLKYINEKNSQAAEEKKNNVNLIRSNYGNEPLDFSVYEKRAADAKNRRASEFDMTIKKRSLENKPTGISAAQHGEERKLPNGRVMVKTPEGWVPK